MNRTRRYRFLAATGAVVMAGLMLSAIPASAAGPTLKYTPKGGLTSGSVVQVSGKGFKPGDQIFVVQCVTADQSPTGGGCNVNGAVPAGTVTSKGKFGPVALTLKTGQIGKDSGTCGTTKADAKACSVSAGTAAGTDTKQVGIKFVVPKA